MQIEVPSWVNGPLRLESDGELVDRYRAWIARVFLDEERGSIHHFGAQLRLAREGNRSSSVPREDFLQLCLEVYAEYVAEHIVGPAGGTPPDDPMVHYRRSQQIRLAVEQELAAWFWSDAEAARRAVGGRVAELVDGELRGLVYRYSEEYLAAREAGESLAARKANAERNRGKRRPPELGLHESDLATLTAYVQLGLDALLSDSRLVGPADLGSIAAVHQAANERHRALAHATAVEAHASFAESEIRALSPPQARPAERSLGDVLVSIWARGQERGLGRDEGVRVLTDAIDRAVDAWPHAGEPRATPATPGEDGCQRTLMVIGTLLEDSGGLVAANLERLGRIRELLEPRDGIEGTAMNPIVAYRFLEMELASTSVSASARRAFEELVVARKEELRRLREIPEWTLVAFSWVGDVDEQARRVGELEASLPAALDALALTATESVWQARAYARSEVSRLQGRVDSFLLLREREEREAAVAHFRKCFDSSVGRVLGVDSGEANPTIEAVDRSGALGTAGMDGDLLQWEALEFMERELARLQGGCLPESVAKQLGDNERIGRSVRIRVHDVPSVDRPRQRSFAEIRKDLEALLGCDG